MAKRWQRVLAGDIGGTKTWLALYDADSEGSRECIAEAKVPSADHESLRSAIEAFLEESGESLDHLRGAAFGIAGPVRGRRVQTTNLPWTIDADELAEALTAESVTLLNDFHAIALGVDELSEDQLPLLKEGEVDPDGPRLILGAGTGLGASVVVPGGRVLPGEGGHLAFAPRDDFEAALLAHLRETHDRVSVERVVSGMGLEAIYRFIVSSGRAETNVRAEGGAAISRAAADGDPAAKLTLERFAIAYGAAAGELALAVLPTGGLYVAGGIAPKLHRTMADFAERFTAGLLPKGRMQPLMEATQVRLVNEPKVGLLGARRVALDAL